MAVLPPPWIAVLACAAWIGCLSLRPFQSLADDRPGRLASLDGLRGILALSVFGHHFAVTTQWQLTGAWKPAPSAIWTLLGQGAVVMFFMITGFLFFGRMRQSRHFDWASFFAGRVLRIYPVYLFALMAVAVCALATPADEAVSGWSTVDDLTRWLRFDPGGLLGFSGAWTVIAGVPWSLRYEWLFYLALPLAFVLWRGCSWSPWLLALLCAITAALTLWPIELASFRFNSALVAPFVFGGLASLVSRESRSAALARGPIGTATILASLTLALQTQTTAFGLACYVLLFCAFAPIALGNSLFGLLTCRAVRILGAASYDIYLLHGIVLFGLFHVLWPHALGAGPAAWALAQMLGTGALVIAFSILVHRTIEMPCMTASLRLSGPDPRERLAAP